MQQLQQGEPLEAARGRRGGGGGGKCQDRATTRHTLMQGTLGVDRMLGAA